MPDTMQVEVVSPERVLFSGEASMVVTRTLGPSSWMKWTFCSPARTRTGLRPGFCVETTSAESGLTDS